MITVIKFDKKKLLDVCPDFQSFKQMCEKQYKAHFKTKDSIVNSWFALTGEMVNVKSKKIKENGDL